MTTDEQIAANQQNALLGGVKTREGKAVSKYNAVKHGILISSLTEEEQQQAKEIQESLTAEFKPQSTVEVVLIERLAIYTVRLQRAIHAESEQLLKIYNPRIAKRSGATMPTVEDLLYGAEEVISSGYQPKVGAGDIERLEKIYLRYETAIERNFYRALHELQRIQAVRQGKHVPAPMVVDITVDKPHEQLQDTDENGFVSQK